MLPSRFMQMICINLHLVQSIWINSRHPSRRKAINKVTFLGTNESVKITSTDNKTGHVRSFSLQRTKNDYTVEMDDTKANFDLTSFKTKLSSPSRREKFKEGVKKVSNFNQENDRVVEKPKNQKPRPEISKITKYERLIKILECTQAAMIIASVVI